MKSLLDGRQMVALHLAQHGNTVCIRLGIDDFVVFRAYNYQVRVMVAFLFSQWLRASRSFTTLCHDMSDFSNNCSALF